MDASASPTRRVLLVEDSEACRHLVRKHLRAEPIELIEAAQADEGMLLALAVAPELILLDLGLPGRDGFEMIRELKEDPRTQSIPVIFFSALATTEKKARGLDLGAVDFLSKPVEPVELRARVRAALRAKHFQDLLEKKAHLDALTGLGNRHALEAQLPAEWAACSRRATSLSVLIADLDRFKAINDRHGHAAGDLVLQGTARILQDTARGSDFVGRYGGEEFVVVASDCDLFGAWALADRFRIALGRMAEPHRPYGERVTASVGIASAPPSDELDPEELLRRADQALYRAKAEGRDTIRAWEIPMTRPIPVAPAIAGRIG